MNPYRRWSVILLGSHGQIIQLYRFKILVWFLVIVFMAALAAAGFYYYRYQTQSHTISRITAQVEKLERKLADYTRERESFQGRLDQLEESPGAEVAELETPELAAGESAPEPEATPVAKLAEIVPLALASDPEAGTEVEGMVSEAAEEESPPESSFESSAAEPAQAGQAPRKRPPADLPADPQGAVISHFESTPLPDLAQLKFAYRVTNETRGPEKLKGYTYALLEGQRDGVANYVVVPEGRASSEPPPLQPEGYPFTVRNYLTIRLTAEAIPDFSWIRQVTIFVCDSEGALIGREQFLLSIE
ncbi:MAG: hypothetical protein WBG37_00100 [Desulfobacterales bacterium]